ncbi:MazG-like family protein [Limosilactobacillus reuteri]|uniref:MazG-like family protein n=1 Tax=Limosilactobacillus reuteri TaxID=1598 RepID=UPI002B053BAC|nr:MazG-like family protein [Limosilactobacillus reuteri]
MNNQILFEEFISKLKQWAAQRNLLDKDPHVQFTKIVEELGETSAAYNKQKHTELVDSIGDLLVTIVVFCHQVGIDPQEAYNYAWHQITNRKGKTVNGVFIKESDLNGCKNKK